VRLAAAGSTILAAATQYARAADAAILDSLPRTKRRAFLNTLTKLAKASEEAAAKLERENKRDAKRAKRQREKKKAQKTRRKRNAAREHSS